MARIALDIDSTLHHYWELLEQIAMERFGVAIPYADQTGWGIDQMPREQVVACIQETHTEANILDAEPYPGAVEVVRGWQEEGHWIHVTSHRAVATRETTAAWLDKIGLPFDDLHCSYDKITRCVELGIDVLVDDSPVNLEQAGQDGIVPATIVHPWNRELVEQGKALGAPDWPALRLALDPVLRESRPWHAPA